MGHRIEARGRPKEASQGGGRATKREREVRSVDELLHLLFVGQNGESGGREKFLWVSVVAGLFLDVCEQAVLLGVHDEGGALLLHVAGAAEAPATSQPLPQRHARA